MSDHVESCLIQHPEITPAPSAPKSLLDLLMGGNNMFKDDSHRKGGLTVSFGVPWMIQTSNLDDGFGFFLISNFQLFAVGHHNPLEQIFDNKDVKIFKPKEAFHKSTTEEEREDLIAPILTEIHNVTTHQLGLPRWVLTIYVCLAINMIFLFCFLYISGYKPGEVLLLGSNHVVVSASQ
jgi:hypothetical protein